MYMAKETYTCQKEPCKRDICMSKRDLQKEIDRLSRHCGIRYIWQKRPTHVPKKPTQEMAKETYVQKRPTKETDEHQKETVAALAC